MTKTEIANLFDEAVVIAKFGGHHAMAEAIVALRDMTNRELFDRERENEMLTVLAKLGGQRVNGEVVATRKDDDKPPFGGHRFCWWAVDTQGQPGPHLCVVVHDVRECGHLSGVTWGTCQWGGQRNKTEVDHEEGPEATEADEHHGPEASASELDERHIDELG